MASETPTHAVSRALDILECFAGGDRELGLVEIGQRLGLPKSTTHRLVSFLVSRRFMAQNPITGKYRLGLKLVELGSLALRQTDLRSEALPHLKRLVESTLETALLLVRDGEVGVYLDILESPRPYTFVSYVGRRMPLHCTATGKAMLAHLREDEVDRIIESAGLARFTDNTFTEPDRLKQHLSHIRAQGYAYDREELQDGVVGIGAPVFNSAGEICCSISVTGPSPRITTQSEFVIAEVVKAARAISRSLGYEPARVPVVSEA